MVAKNSKLGLLITSDL